MAINDRIVELRRVAASELLNNPKNWRRHPAAQRAALAQLVQEIGWADVCLARGTPEGLVLIDGHLRRDLGADEVIPVLVLDVTEAEADTLLASVDPLAGMAVADEAALCRLVDAAQLTEELRDELQRRYLRGLWPIGTHEEIPPLPATLRMAPGELWALGGHRLLCGDATRAGDLTRLMEGEPGDVLWTDPPYGVGYVGKTADALTIANDAEGDLPGLLQAAFGAADSVLRPGAALYVCHPAGPGSVVFSQAFLQAGWRLHQTLVWTKDRAVLGHGDYHYRHEPILYGYKPGRGRRGRGHGGWYGGNDQDSVFEIDRPAASREHPTAKPVELVARCLENSSRTGGVVLDPFAGSGSTLVAAERLGRRARAVEIDPVYCDVILRRWEAVSGREAKRLDG